MQNIIIADNQLLFCIGIQSILQNNADLRVIDYTTTGKNLFQKIKLGKPDVLLIDFENLTDFVITDFSQIKQSFPALNICVISACKDKDQILKVLKTGITTIISKECNFDELKTAIRATLSNEKCFSDFVLDILLDKQSSNKEETKATTLTNKEIEIVRLLSQGLTTKDIAARIFISHHTVNTHRKNILAKLQIKNTSELVTLAMRNGWIDPIEYYI